MPTPSLEDISKNLQNAKSIISKAVDSISQNLQETTATANNTLSSTLNSSLSNLADKIAAKSSQLLNSVSDAENTLKDSLQTSIEKIDSLNQTLSDAIQTSINSSLHSWIDKYPQLVWLINHPVQLLGILLSSLFLFSGLLGAISRLTEKFWLFILTYPFKALSKAWRLIFSSLRPKNIDQPAPAQKRVMEILIRLESLRQEQTLLSQELESLLK